MRTKKITMIQAAMIAMLTIGVSNHVILIPILLQTASRDAWVGVMMAVVPLFLWILILYYVSKRMAGETFSVWLKRQLSPYIAWPVVAVLAAYLFAIAFNSVKDTVTWARASYLPQTPAIALCLPLCALCMFAARAGIRAIAITSGILLPGVVLLGIFVMTVNFQFKDYTLIFPLFTHGYRPSLTGMSYVMGGFCEMIAFLFIQHRLSGQVRLARFLFLGFILIGLTIGPLIGAIAIFGPFEAAAQRYSPFEQWRMAHIGKFLTHLDFLSIYQWMSGSFIRIAFCLFLITELFGLAKKRTAALLVLAALLVGVFMIPMSDPYFLDWLVKWFYPASLMSIVAISGLLLLAAARPQTLGGERHGE